MSDNSLAGPRDWLELLNFGKLWLSHSNMERINIPTLNVIVRIKKN